MFFCNYKLNSGCTLVAHICSVSLSYWFKLPSSSSMTPTVSPAANRLDLINFLVPFYHRALSPKPGQNRIFFSTFRRAFRQGVVYFDSSLGSWDRDQNIWLKIAYVVKPVHQCMYIKAYGGPLITRMLGPPKSTLIIGKLLYRRSF